MTKGAAILWLSALVVAAFGISAIVEVAQEITTRVEAAESERVIRVVLGGGSLLAWSGVIPLIWWGIRRFSRMNAMGPLLMWTATLVLVGFLSLLGITINPLTG